MLRATLHVLLFGSSCLILAWSGPPSVPLLAQAADRAPRSTTQALPTIDGRVTATAEHIPLAGIAMTLRAADGRAVATVLSGADGRFHMPAPSPGPYTIETNAQGFDPFSLPVTIEAGASRVVTCELTLSAMAERVEVVTPTRSELGFSVTTPMGARSFTDAGGLAESALTASDLSAALNLMPGVIAQASAFSIRGGRTGQSRMQVDGTDVSDPASGESWYRLPSDAVSFVEVLANPAAVEFGRFGSGLTVFQSRRAERHWSAAVNNLEPGLVTKRGNPLKVIGLESASPRLTFGGPLVKDRLSVVESVQLRYMSSELQSRPQDERRVNLNVSSFLRLDGTLGTRHSLAATVGLYHKRVQALNIDTFTAPDAAADVRYQAALVTVRETAQLAASWVVESQLQWGLARSGTDPRRAGPYVLSPDERRGGFFNTQDRRSSSWSAGVTATSSRAGPIGLHLFKVGVDLQRVAFRGSSVSRAVDVVDGAGSLLTRITFGDSGPQVIATTDAGAFVQDRWVVSSRLQAEFGARLDYNGVSRSSLVSPRVGAALALRSDRSTILRGGVGRFAERTPSLSGVFEAFESRTEWRGGSAAGASAEPVHWVLRSRDEPGEARSLTWDVALDHRVTPTLTLRLQTVHRRSSHELLIEPTGSGPLRWIDLTSSGRSTYRDVEVAFRYEPRPGTQVNAAYTRASAMADLNTFAARFDLIRDPLLRANAFAPAPLSAPHRLILRTGMPVTSAWRLDTALVWRSGFPWTALGPDLQYAEAPNRRRLPASALLDVSVERRLRIWKANGWLGVTVFNALNQRSPSDVQANLASWRFGQTFNRETLQVRLGWRMY